MEAYNESRSLSKILKDAQYNKKVKVITLATKIDVGRTTMSRILNGWIVPTEQQVRDLAKVLGLDDVDMLLGLREKERQRRDEREQIRSVISLGKQLATSLDKQSDLTFEDSLLVTLNSRAQAYMLQGMRYGDERDADAALETFERAVRVTEVMAGRSESAFGTHALATNLYGSAYMTIVDGNLGAEIVLSAAVAYRYLAKQEPRKWQPQYVRALGEAALGMAKTGDKAAKTIANLTLEAAHEHHEMFPNEESESGEESNATAQFRWAISLYYQVLKLIDEEGEAQRFASEIGWENLGENEDDD